MRKMERRFSIFPKIGSPGLQWYLIWLEYTLVSELQSSGTPNSIYILETLADSFLQTLISSKRYALFYQPANHDMVPSTAKKAWFAGNKLWKE